MVKGRSPARSPFPPFPMKRRETRVVYKGSVAVGGDNPVSVQSMTKTPTADVERTLAQVKALRAAGCRIVRIAVPDEESALSLAAIKKGAGDTPIVADIHFDYRLALKSIEMGADAIRINPGNIGGKDRIRAVVNAARERSISIRIGVNAGSLEREFLRKYGGPTAAALAESALKHVGILESLEFTDIVLSMKAADVERTVQAYRYAAGRTPYPFHLGVTEAGTFLSGTVKSALGIGILLAEGIGDTIRVSLTADPVEEVRVGKEILKSLGLMKKGIQLVSCPTCARTEIDVAGLASELEAEFASVSEPLTIAVMGCAVNGPGEAREADVGVAGSRTFGLIFRRGEVVRSVPKDEIRGALKEEIRRWVGEEKK
jgi:(E)-4-hydroxy-3-methylbut-2-enyl-diphosphate synthase